MACSLLRGALAVTCESFKTETDCEGVVTSSGKCGFRNGACAVVEPLGDGMFGIASLPSSGDPPGSIVGVPSGVQPDVTTQNPRGQGESQEQEQVETDVERVGNASSPLSAPGTALFCALVGSVLLVMLT